MYVELSSLVLAALNVIVSMSISLYEFTDSCHQVNESISFERVAEQQERVHWLRLNW